MLRVPPSIDKMGCTTFDCPFIGFGIHKLIGPPTVAVIIDAVVGNLSSVDPHVASEVGVIGLDPGVDDAHSNVVAARGLGGPVTWGLHQIQVVQVVTIGRVGILHLDLVV